MSTMKELPASERPIERLKRIGPDGLSTIELLAVMLQSGTTDRNAKQLAEEILDELSLHGLASAGCSQLQGFRGIGDVKAARIVAAFELSARHRERVAETVTSYEEAERLLGQALRDEEQEEFHMALLTTGNSLIDTVRIHRGSLRSLDIDTREVVRTALTHNAAAVILAHNHPGGEATPSASDTRTTKRLIDELETYDIRVLDHLIFGREETVSMRRRGDIS